MGIAAGVLLSFQTMPLFQRSNMEEEAEFE